jgi:uncharacterized protein YdeI (YjbR/CyaY-like superfamily)
MAFREISDKQPPSTKRKTNPKVRRSPMEHPRHQYPRETEELQKIAESRGLTEQVKWGKPCYTLNGRNVVLIQRFNEYIALLFFKGALLKDPENLLSRIGEHMEAPRQLRFTSLSDIVRLKPKIKAYIEEAIELEKAGAKVQVRKTADYKIPDELQTKLKENPDLKKAFAALTSGRQKAYIFQIAAAKQAATRAARVEKYSPQILAGKGLND